MDRVKVKMLIWSIPSYRAPIFRHLSQSPSMDFEVWAGDDPGAIDGARVPCANEVGQADGIRWRRLKSRRLRWPRNYEWQPGAVVLAIKEDFDVLLCQGNKSLSNWLIWGVCRLRGIPVINWTIGVMGPESGLKWTIRKILLRCMNAHMLYGRYARAFFAEHGLRRDRLFIIHNSLDYNKQVSLRNALTPSDLQAQRVRFGVTGPDDRLLFHTGRLEKKKNLSVLLKAIKKLKEEGRRIVVVIIGDGRERDRWRKEAQEDGIGDQAIFYGPCYEEETVGPIIAASDLAVVPGVTGLIAMHSMVYGTPILTRDNSARLHGPEVEAVIEGQTGGFFRDGDVEDLTRKMEAMLYPVSCKETMREACMKIIDEEYNPTYQERVVIQAINSVVPEERRIRNVPAYGCREQDKSREPQ